MSPEAMYLDGQSCFWIDEVGRIRSPHLGVEFRIGVSALAVQPVDDSVEEPLKLTLPWILFGQTRTLFDLASHSGYWKGAKERPFVCVELPVMDDNSRRRLLEAIGDEFN